MSYMAPESQPMTAYRSLRILTGLSLREVSRRTGIKPGRLSIVERGVPPTQDEYHRLMACLVPLTKAEGTDG